MFKKLKISKFLQFQSQKLSEMFQNTSVSVFNALRRCLWSGGKQTVWAINRQGGRPFERLGTWLAEWLACLTDGWLGARVTERAVG